MNNIYINLKIIYHKRKLNKTNHGQQKDEKEIHQGVNLSPSIILGKTKEVNFTFLC